jgi:RimJ/RimL family protein N-acetyltransferase
MWAEGLVMRPPGEEVLEWIDRGFRELDLPYFTANIAPENAASTAVAECLGMAPLREDTLHGGPVVVYAVRREDGVTTR